VKQRDREEGASQSAKRKAFSRSEKHPR
jgi:hypothetical protein